MEDTGTGVMKKKKKSKAKIEKEKNGVFGGFGPKSGKNEVGVGRSNGTLRGGRAQ